MSELMTQPDKLRADAAECALIRDLATDRDKRELFARLAEHLSTLAVEVERRPHAGLQPQLSDNGNSRQAGVVADAGTSATQSRNSASL
ncbi:conserved hypothetical protein [Bradyrhizobium oligotrophicum S58]|uniref:Uncharacterized protein n=1 Tax=Bradyrhizobium oligotrophicum S58 TaxID=1245469 RepID=M4ZBE1_9BRAD|nr:hypothetical protein [Bradyrhizobium oligotrophicum]BAM90776.1 conserved hypothetical protein [Bradyrhizobium oligotrophicum S58]